MPEVLLIIEDDAQIASALSVRLSALGYEVCVAYDGASGIAKAASASPAAVLLDIRLPDINGIEVCRQIKQNPQTAHLPVLLLSANVSNDTRNQAREAGALACLVKPYDFRELTAMIESAVCT